MADVTLLFECRVVHAGQWERGELAPHTPHWEQMPEGLEGLEGRGGRGRRRPALCRQGELELLRAEPEVPAADAADLSVLDHVRVHLNQDVCDLFGGGAGKQRGL